MVSIAGRETILAGSEAVNPKLVVIPFAIIQWLVFWGMRYLPYPIKNPALRLAAQITFPSVGLGMWFVQLRLYQSMTGIAVVKNDRYFMALTFTEYIVSAAIILRVAYEFRNRERESRSTSTRTAET